MKILYLSCHSILEFDELSIFNELGIDFFSLGSYVNPQYPVDGIRPAIDYTPDPWLVANTPDRDNIPQEFIDKFDAIVVMHVPEWIEKNWDKFKGKKVYWRTIGQSTPSVERRMWKFRPEGLKVIRYSPREANLTDVCGCDKVVRFYKDEKQFANWNGSGNEVITFAQDMQHRGEFCNYEAFTQIVAGFNAHVYGPKNEGSGALNGGFLTYAQMQQKMRDARVYIYTGTQPASYTLNFIEAMMTGVPIVAIGPKLASTLSKGLGIDSDLYEIPDIIQNGVNGFVSDDINELRGHVQFLLDNFKAAQRIGQMGRQRAIELFGKEVIKNKWREALEI